MRNFYVKKYLKRKIEEISVLFGSYGINKYHTFIRVNRISSKSC